MVCQSSTSNNEVLSTPSETHHFQMNLQNKQLTKFVSRIGIENTAINARNSNKQHNQHVEDLKTIGKGRY